MRIAILVPDNRDEFRRYADPEPHFGQAPTALLSGLEAMPECEIHIVCCVQRPLHSPPKLAGNIYFHSLLVPKWGWMRGAYLGCIRAIRRKLREIKPDIVHGQGTERYGALAAACSGYPNVLTIHGNMRLISKINHARPFSFQWLAARLETFTLPRSNGVICITSYTQRAVASLARATWIVPNAVDVSFFALEPLPVHPAEIVCVANISARKNQAQLIRALKPLTANHPFKLLFYGGADRQDPYVRKFFELLEANPWCHFEGFADRAALRAAMKRASLLVLPSLEDNCPMCVLEAMAGGVPVAASNVGGLPGLIAHGCDGLLFDPTKEEDISAAVATLLMDDGMAARLAAKAKESALQKFHPQKIAQEHVSIYGQILQNRL